MKILLFHPVLLPPRDYGGVERVVLWLARGLKELGHEVFVGALPKSQLPSGCHLIEIDARHYEAQDLMAILPKDLDIIHFHAPISESVWEKLPFPKVLTIHGNGKPGEKFPANTIFLSLDHAHRHGFDFYIYNGLDPKEYLYNPSTKKKSYLFLSKTSWKVKNLQGAMRYCAQAGVALDIAGGNRPFLKKIETLFFRPHFKWIGAVSGEQKAKLLCQAKALIFPVSWLEPFGLVVIEALISGTPVLASEQGSLRELVPHNVGALINSESQWLYFLKQEKLPWKPEDCRKWAMENFHYSKMAKNYETAYFKVIQGEALNSKKWADSSKNNEQV